MEAGTTENEQIKNNLNILGLTESTDKAILEEFKDIIINKFETENHLNIIRMLKSERYINDKILLQKENSFNIASLGSSYNKIKLLLQLEKDMRLERLEINYENVEYFEITEKRYTLFKKVFRITKPKPTTKLLLFQLYIALLKNIASNDIIITTRIGQKVKTTIYKLNDECIMRHIKLNKIKNTNYKDYDITFIKLFQLEKAQEVYPFDKDDSINLLDCAIK